MVELFILTLLVTIAAQFAPGPNFLAVATGVASGVFFWVILGAFGLGSLLELVPSALLGLKIAGGLYMLFLASRGLHAAIRG